MKKVCADIYNHSDAILRHPGTHKALHHDIVTRSGKILNDRISSNLKHKGAQTILVTNLVTNSVTNLSPDLVITKQSDKFVTKFVTKIGVHQIW